MKNGNKWTVFDDANMKGAGLFKDDEFPADESSLFWRNHLVNAKDAKDMKKGITAWKRPSEMKYKNDPELWGSLGYPAPSGVH